MLARRARARSAGWYTFGMMGNEQSKNRILAAVCREFATPLSLEQVILSPPQAGEVRVKLSACAICHSDIMYMQGQWGGRLPTVFGHEAAGVVAEWGDEDYPPELAAGAAVVVALMRACGWCAACDAGRPALCRTPFASDDAPRLRSPAGEPIYAGLRTGAFAEEVVVHRSQVVAAPDGMDLELACLLSCGVMTGVGAALNTARLPAGARVAVVGCGGVGLNCVQGAKIAAARTIVALDVDEDKLRAARELGATDAVLCGSDVDAAAAVAKTAGGDGFDYVFMAAGRSAAVNLALDLLAAMGTLVLAGMPASGDLARLDATDIAGGGKRIVGSKMGDGRLRVDIPMLAAFYGDGRLKLRELVNRRFAFADINAAIHDAKKSDSLRNILIF